MRAAKGPQAGPLCLTAAAPPRSWDQDRKWFESWDEEVVGTFSNWGFQDDENPDKDKNFHVALEKVDTTMKVHIKRPEMTSSSV